MKVKLTKNYLHMGRLKEKGLLMTVDRELGEKLIRLRVARKYPNAFDKLLKK